MRFKNAVFSLPCLGATLLLFSWKAERLPVDRVEITSTFGESRGDHFHSGLDFAYVQNIKAVAKGEVLFYKDFHENPSIPHYGSGNFIIVGHEDDIRTYYFHLEDKTVNPRLTTVNQDDVLGVVGSSGHSTGAHLHFVVEDAKNKRILNPLDIFEPLSDSVPPKINSFYVVINEKVISFRRPKPVLHYRGKMNMFIFANDLRKVWTPKGLIYFPFGAKRVTLTIDQKIFRDYDFSYMLKSPDGLEIFPNHTHDEIYGVKYNYRMGSFFPTKLQHTLDISVEDYAGNRSTKRFLATFK